MTIVKFEQISRPVKRSGKCYGGFYHTQRRTFTNTVNPFNKNKDGSIKTPQQVFIDVRKESDKWASQPIECNNLSHKI